MWRSTFPFEEKLDHLHSKVKIRTIRMVGYRLEQET